LSLDIEGLRNGLFNGAFTCSDLVEMFAERCWTIGRGLNLIAEENFVEARLLALEKDVIL
jgi:hypothetical protein